MPSALGKRCARTVIPSSDAGRWPVGNRCRYCAGSVEWKDNRGWFRNFCEECAAAVAEGHDLRATHDPDGEPVEDPERGA